jgi:hypothetical protein
MEQTVNERIKILVDQLASGNKSSFARSIGISNQSLGEIIGGRQSAPSFAALQKIFMSFPQVRMEWLILGSGSMLHTNEALSGKTLDPFAGTGSAHQAAEQAVITTEAWQNLQALAEEVQRRLDNIDEEVVQRKSDEEATYVLYSITGRADAKRPYDGLLSNRLGISVEQAQQLAESGKIQVLRFGKTDDDVKGWRVSELTVRKYLGDTSEETSKK